MSGWWRTRSVASASRGGVPASLAFVVGAFMMLFDGVKLPVSNWRLALVQLAITPHWHDKATVQA
jgi:hypothetical protein